MKAPILTIVLLMFVLATFAQTSRRYSSESNTENNDRRSTVNQQQRDNSNQRNYSSENTRRETQGRQGQERKEEKKEEKREYQRHSDKQVSSERRVENNRTYSNSNNRTVVHNHGRRHVVSQPVVVTNYSRSSYHRPTVVRHVHYNYRTPVRTEIVWSVNMCRDYRVYYPEVRHWKYHTGHRVTSIPAYDAYDYIGEVANVYGKVREVYYEPESDEFFLYFGDYYPYHDFSIIISGYEARVFARNPVRYFEGEHIAATGYVSVYDGKPEMRIRRAAQINVY